MTWGKLIAELEAATEGSRELDAKITAAVKGRVFKKWLGYYYEFEGGVGGYGGNKQDMPLYTTSLDAALTLVPEGMLWQVSTAESEADVIWESSPSHYTERAVGESWAADEDTFNPALALCIATLKARQATEDS